MCVEGGSIWAVQVEGTAAAAGLSIVISTSALDESLGVVVVWEQASGVTMTFAVTWVYKEECMFRMYLRVKQLKTHPKAF